MKHQQGFTLIEALVAFVIVAVALPALIRLISVQGDGIAIMRDKLHAQWVASYVIENKRFYRGINRRWDADQGNLEMMSRQWRWEEFREETALDNFYEYRLVIRVVGSDDVIYEARRYASE